MELFLDNFRSFKNQNFKFSKFNILIGENSSGKSSILKFFLILKQSLQSFQSRSAINITLQGDYVDLGNYEEMIYYHDLSQTLTFSFTLDSDYPLFFKSYVTKTEKRNINSKNEDNNILEVYRLLKDYPTKISFSLSKDLKQHDNIKTIISNPKLGSIEIVTKLNENKEIENVISSDAICDIIFIDLDNNKTEYTNIEYEKDAFFSMVKGYSLNEKFDKKFSVDFYQIAYLLITQNFIERFAQRIQFINPINSVPKRFLFRKDPSSKYINLNLEELVNILSDETLDKISSEKLISKINEAVNFFGIANEIKINKDNKIPVVELKAKVKDLWSNITDVGYGTSLQLPILFQIILSNTKSGGENILIEQPEVHLHPKLQAQFIETILKFGFNNKYFIETHSEHIVRKLQIMVKNNMYGIKPSDITIHYFRRENEVSHVTFHEILSDGKLNPNFPSGFFDSSYLLAKELL